MAQKKETNETRKPGVKVQDLAPKKDAKGGAGTLSTTTKLGANASKTGPSANRAGLA